LSRRADFEALVARHQGGVLRLCRSILRDEHLGADAAQETFLRLWGALADGRAPSTPAGWLRRVALSVSLDELRSGKRRARRHETVAREAADAQPSAGHGGPGAVGPEEALATEELRRRFDAALARLPEGQRTVFLLRHSAGLSLAEAAETLGVAPATIKTQFARACLRLQSALQPFRPDGTGDPGGPGRPGRPHDDR